MDEEVFQHNGLQFLLRVFRDLRSLFFTGVSPRRRHVHEREEAGFRRCYVHPTAGAHVAACDDVHDVLLHNLRSHPTRQGQRVHGGGGFQEQECVNIHL